jgi:hypothetical protein
MSLAFRAPFTAKMTMMPRINAKEIVEYASQ